MKKSDNTKQSFLENEDSILKISEAFLKMHLDGIRFYTEEDLNDPTTGFWEKIQPGIYRVTTLKGLMLEAEKGLLTYKGRPMTLEEVELFVNLFVFICKNFLSVRKRRNKPFH